MTMSTSSDTDIRPNLGDPALDDESPRVAHIVAKGGVAEAYVLGTPLEALCGAVFVPSRDPKKLPVCEACKEALKARGHDPDSVS
jgi:hypothetical protein